MQKRTQNQKWKMKIGNMISQLLVAIKILCNYGMYYFNSFLFQCSSATKDKNQIKLFVRIANKGLTGAGTQDMLINACK